MINFSAYYLSDNREREHCEITVNNRCMKCEIGLINSYIINEDIFRIRTVNAISILNIVTVYVNYHLFHLGIQEYIVLRNYSEENNILIIEPNDNIWEEIHKKSLEITDYTIVNNFIDEIDKKYFCKPEYYYKIRKNISDDEIKSRLISLSKKKEALINEDVIDFKVLYHRFVFIMCKEYNIKKEYGLECVWILLENCLHMKFAKQWLIEYNNGFSIQSHNLEITIDEALRLGGLGKRKDDKYGMFIYYCIYHGFTMAKNFYDAWFELENPIRQRINIRETDILEKS